MITVPEYPKTLGLRLPLHCPECKGKYTVRNYDGTVYLAHLPPHETPTCSWVNSIHQWPNTKSIPTRPRGEGTPLLVLPNFTKCPEPTCDRALSAYSIHELRVQYTHSTYGKFCPPAYETHSRCFPLALLTVWI